MHVGKGTETQNGTMKERKRTLRARLQDHFYCRKADNTSAGREGKTNMIQSRVYTTSNHSAGWQAYHARQQKTKGRGEEGKAMLLYSRCAYWDLHSLHLLLAFTKKQNFPVSSTRCDSYMTKIWWVKLYKFWKSRSTTLLQRRPLITYVTGAVKIRARSATKL